MPAMTDMFARIGSCAVAGAAALGCGSDPPSSTIVVGAVYDRFVTYATTEAFGISSTASAVTWIQRLFPALPPPVVEQLQVNAQVDVDSYNFGADLTLIADNKTGPAFDVY